MRCMPCREFFMLCGTLKNDFANVFISVERDKKFFFSITLEKVLTNQKNGIQWLYKANNS